MLQRAQRAARSQITTRTEYIGETRGEIRNAPKIAVDKTHYETALYISSRILSMTGKLYEGGNKRFRQKGKNKRNLFLKQIWHISG